MGFVELARYGERAVPAYQEHTSRHAVFLFAFKMRSGRTNSISLSDALVDNGDEVGAKSGIPGFKNSMRKRVLGVVIWSKDRFIRY